MPQFRVTVHSVERKTYYLEADSADEAARLVESSDNPGREFPHQLTYEQSGIDSVYRSETFPPTPVTNIGI